MFAETDLDLKKRIQRDDCLTKMQELARNQFFEEHFYLLAGIYDKEATLKDEGYLEMSKSDFVNILKVTDSLIKPKPKAQEQ